MPKVEKEFDYIIVGGGSAGCVLAHRLTESEDVSVLLVESGGSDWHPYIKIPGAYLKLFRTRMDWQFWTEPQTHVGNRKIYLPRGKTLGGSSSTNAMAYVRGNHRDYDEWAELGNTGWGYEDVLPYFLKSENNEQAELLDPGYHQQGGPLHVSFQHRFKTPFAAAFVESGKSLGLPENKDYNGKSQEGIGKFQFTIKNGVRHSAASAFLKPARQRPNLAIQTHCTVSSIELAGDRARSISVIRKGQHQVFHAAREIILSAGSFGSPQLLMLSGIGDPDELSKHGISVKHSIPGVGKNLQDHLFFPISATSPLRKGFNHFIPWHQQLLAMLNFLIFRQGPFTASILEAVAFLNPEDFSKPANFQFHFGPTQLGKDYSKDKYDIRNFPTSPDGFTILPSLLKPQSRGSVSLHSSHPTDAPRIDPCFLAEPADLQKLIQGGKVAYELLNQKAMEQVSPNILSPGDPRNDNDWIQHIRSSLETIYHPVGTCKMGTDSMAVVDPELKVHGLTGLRVVDASIMPTIITGNTNAPVYMIAEKAADMIKDAT